MATQSSILAWGIPWPVEPGGLQSTGSQRVGQNWVTATFTFYIHNKPHKVSLENISIPLLQIGSSKELTSYLERHGIQRPTVASKALCDPLALHVSHLTPPTSHSLSSRHKGLPSAPRTHEFLLSSCSIFAGHSSYLHAADSLPLGAQSKGHLLREASTVTQSKEASFVPS